MLYYIISFILYASLLKYINNAKNYLTFICVCQGLSTIGGVADNNFIIVYETNYQCIKFQL